jgi:outer membrane protein insertion porin family
LKKTSLFLLLISFLNAYTVSKIEFEGLSYLSENSAKELLDFYSDTVTDKQINDSIKKLYSQGYFDDIFVEYKNETLIFHFIEKSTISKVTLTGFLDTDDERQKEFLQLSKGNLFDKAKVEEVKTRISEALNFKGSVDNAIEIRETKLDNGTTEIEFLVREGEEIIIKDLELSGREKESFTKIENNMGNKHKEGFGWLMGRNSGEMKIKELEIDSARIKDYYMRRGYIDVVVSKPFAQIEFNRYTSSLKYEISEGVPYDVSGIEIEIDRDIVDLEELKENFKLEAGDRFNIDWVRKDISKIKTAVADKGYAFVNIYPNFERDREKQEVKVVYKVRTKSRVKIRDVIISNNRVTLDRVIRREVFVAPGDWYNLTDIKDSKNALGRLGYFDEVNLEEIKVSDTEIDIAVYVKEGRTGSIQVGGGYSTYLGFTFDTSLTDRNVFGSGIDMSLAFQYSKISKTYTLSFSNPRLFDSLYSGTFNVTHSEIDRDYYDVVDRGFGFNIGRRIGRHFTANFGYSYSDTQYTNVDDNLTDDAESYIKSAVSLGLKYDTTDDYFVPREGVTIYNGVEYAGVGGTAKFVKNTLSFNVYQGLQDYIDYDMILRYKSKLRYMKDTGMIPLYESLHMGGIGTVRGYDPFSFPNRELDEYQNMKALRSFTHSFEISLPISEQAKLRWTPFIDYGYLGDNDFEDFKRGGYGISLEWQSPMAPIQFIFSRPFDDKPTDDISKFEFTMGRRF